MPRKPQPDPERYAVLRQMPRKIRCRSCGCESGVEGEWKRQPALVEELRKRGWHLFHCGHVPGVDGDPRGWLCCACSLTWRDGLAVRDAEKIHGQEQVKREA